jgi:predicted RNA-binding protein with PIN domain
MPPPLPVKLEDQRSRLIRYIEVRQPQGSVQNEVTVIFDGQEGVDGWNRCHAVKVIFSTGETADDVIRKMVEHSSRVKQMVVVTDDRALGVACRNYGAKIRSVDDFMCFRGSRRERMVTRTKTKIVSKELPWSLQDQITRELKDIWVRPPKDKR